MQRMCVCGEFHPVQVQTTVGDRTRDVAIPNEPNATKDRLALFVALSRLRIESEPRAETAMYVRTFQVNFDRKMYTRIVQDCARN